MKKTKKVEELWVNPLRKELEKVAPFKSPALRSKQGLQIKRQAIGEIMRGVSFCIKRKLKVQVTLERRFNIGHYCHCLLALNSPQKDFFLALDNLRISETFAQRIGCIESDTVDTYLWEKTPGECWDTLYQRLWRTTGRFFRDHPKFGVN